MGGRGGKEIVRRREWRKTYIQIEWSRGNDDWRQYDEK